MYLTYPGFKLLGTAYNINEAFVKQVMSSA